MPLLTSRTWKTSYRNEDGNLVKLFFEPALECAKTYDRATGYFSADVLGLAARGIGSLIESGAKMRLLVGCTLRPPETEAMTQGYDLRAEIAKSLAATPLIPANESARTNLEQLAWMIANKVLDVKVAVPVDSKGNPVFAQGLYHEKVGIIEDDSGNRLSFSGSINETEAGWARNAESFHVHGSWRGNSGHVEDEREAFEKLWSGKPTSVKVYDFTDAVKEKLLQFLPDNSSFISPPVSPTPTEPTYKLTPDEYRSAVWGFIRHAAEMPNGLRVGEFTSAVSPWPHQILTYTRFLSNWPTRILIADEVGLGKTISAGLILRQAILSGKAKRILIMVPAGVMVQWQNELYEKFNLSIPRYEDDKLVWRDIYGERQAREKKIGRTEWASQPFVICSSHLMRRKDRVPELLSAEPWDLLIVDEAHHARRKSPGSNQEGRPNRLLSLLNQLQSRCASLLLITATPMQVHPVEVWDLLNLLGLPPEWAADDSSISRYFELTAGNPGQHDLEHLAELFRATETAFGAFSDDMAAQILPQSTSIRRRKILKALRANSQDFLGRRNLTAPERMELCGLLQKTSPLRCMMIRNTRALLRRYVELGILKIPIAKRKVETRAIQMTASERRVYERVETYISETYNAATPDKRNAIGFVMTIYRRRLASSFAALRCTLQKRLEGSTVATAEDLSLDETADEQMTLEDAQVEAGSSLGAIEEGEIHSLLREISTLNIDSKARQLLTDLKNLFASYQSAIVFTQYTDTLDFIKEYLATELADKRLATYQGSGGSWLDSGGDWKRVSKEEIKRRLRDGKVDILLCTDAAGEGLNLQTCGALINYDLPWNPMKVEQRIGRIDRIGQKYPEVRIVNFGYKDSVEADVFFTVGSRINLFENVVGKLQPILSRLPRQIEKFTLSHPAAKADAQRQFIEELNAEIDQANEAAFDIDTSTAESLELPDFPPPSLTAEQLEELMQHKEAIPAGVAWQRKDPRSYGLSLPGNLKEMRITTNPEDFDFGSDNLQFFTPGGPVFACVSAMVPPQNEENGDGLCWLIDRKYTVRSHGSSWEVVDSLESLLLWAANPGLPGPAPDDSAHHAKRFA